MLAAYRLRKAWKFYELAFDLVKKNEEWNKIFLINEENPEDEETEKVWEILMNSSPASNTLNSEELRARNIVGRLIFGKGLFWYAKKSEIKAQKLTFHESK